MQFGVDISEEQILSWGHGILETLLLDHTTGRNIIWATKDYEHLGDGYGFFDEITIDKITENHNIIIRPRVTKSVENQKNRSKDKAEVFTPSWVCNAQNNLIDKAWFETENDIFNHEAEKSWVSLSVPNQCYPTGKNWHKYISSTRLEMACGEAPYLTSRYDTTTGEMIDVNNRIGLLDRKFHIIKHNIPDLRDDMNKNEKKNIKQAWRRHALRALQSTYGFEWQGDNLLLARENLLISFLEFYQDKWSVNEFKEWKTLSHVAEIISWNIWQMNGLKLGIPGYEPVEQINTAGRFFDTPIPPCQRVCHIKEWHGVEPPYGDEVIFKTLVTQNKK